MIFDKKYIRFSKAEIVEKCCFTVSIYINMALIESFVETFFLIRDQDNYSHIERVSFTTLHVRNTEFSRDYHEVLVKESIDGVATILGKALEEQNNWRR